MACYVRKYAEPELNAAAGDLDARRRVRQARNDLADTIVRSGNPRQKNRGGVGDDDRLTGEPNC